LLKKLKMPDLVINTGPIIALAAAMGNLNFLNRIYNQILLPREVILELEAGGIDCVELVAIREASQVFQSVQTEINLPILLGSQLDRGEASVIQTAVIHRVAVVAIDEKLGRRFARLHELRVTGSLGILLKAARAGLVPSLETCFQRMNDHGVWISRDLQELALKAYYETLN
jgi:predicted nucleic acid-binding protein